jgi:homocysteine S-methyltransferase
MAAIAEGRCAVLDGGVATELGGAVPDRLALDEAAWGLRTLIDAPESVLRVHRAYVAAGCDVVTTNTWGLASALAREGSGTWDAEGEPVHWLDVARRALRLARGAAVEAGRERECAVAFSLNGDVDSPHGRETIQLLSRLFADEPPDVLLLETLSLVRPSLFETVEALLATGLPVWLSFRRCRHGLCGVYGQHWGGPEGDAFGRAAMRLEQMGVGALLVNCIPPDHVAGMVSYLRDFTDLPLGVYPNLGYLTSQGWRFDQGVDGGEYARMALAWREEGAQIVGGCCGVGPAHIEAACARLHDDAAAPEPSAPAEAPARPAGELPPRRAPQGGPWTDRRGRPLYPLPFPDLVCEPGVAAPGAASFMTWRSLHAERVGAHQRCLDVGCGAGLQTVQLALNGAAHVHAIDVDERAVASTLANAFRNGVADRVSAAAEDVYPWVPEERYDVVVASAVEAPVDPLQQVSGHRPVDWWGRGLLDQLIAKLPDALAPEGVAYVECLSVASQQRTLELLAAAGLVAEVRDYTLFEFTPALARSGAQIARVEALTDAYHVALGAHDVMVAYLLEIRHAAVHARDVLDDALVIARAGASRAARSSA